MVLKIIDQWDKLREKYQDDGDPDNPRKTTKQRKAGELANAVFKEFLPPEDSEQHEKIEEWSKELHQDASFNFESYADSFVSENLTRNYIREKNISLDDDAIREVRIWKEREDKGKRRGNLSIDIRDSNEDLFYLDMLHLAKLADPAMDGYPDHLHTDEKQFTPIRNAVMHTSRLTNEAKLKLTSVFGNIKAKIKRLLSDNN